MTSAVSMLEAPAPIGPVNWIGLQTLYVKEVRRFFKVLPQTVLAPMVTTLLFLIVFKVAIASGRTPPPGGVSFEHFLAPGLIMMAIIQNAFMNTSSSLLVSKVQGNVVDILMPPLSPAELTLALVLGGVTRGLVVALSITLGMLILPFPTVMVTHLWAILYFALAGSALLSALGVLAGVWGEKFDHVAVVTNFVVTPLSFLSGTFYSVDRLGPFWTGVSHANPFFFLINGFRYGFTGQSATPELWPGVVVLLVLNVAAFAACHQIFKSGWRLKS
jgi:ABC-2 type transport system permease protein